MQGFELKFNIYAETADEVADARNAIVDFINFHAKQGRAVTARKIADAVRKWDKNVLIKNEITKYFTDYGK